MISYNKNEVGSICGWGSDHQNNQEAFQLFSIIQRRNNKQFLPSIYEKKMGKKDKKNIIDLQMEEKQMQRKSQMNIFEKQTKTQMTRNQKGISQGKTCGKFNNFTKGNQRINISKEFTQENEAQADHLQRKYIKKEPKFTLKPAKSHNNLSFGFTKYLKPNSSQTRTYQYTLDYKKANFLAIRERDNQKSLEKSDLISKSRKITHGKSSTLKTYAEYQRKNNYKLDKAMFFAKVILSKNRQKTKNLQKNAINSKKRRHYEILVSRQLTLHNKKPTDCQINKQFNDHYLFYNYSKVLQSKQRVKSLITEEVEVKSLLKQKY